MSDERRAEIEAAQAQERRQKLLDMLLDHDACDADLLVRKIEKLYGKAR